MHGPCLCGQPLKWNSNASLPTEQADVRTAALAPEQCGAFVLAFCMTSRVLPLGFSTCTGRLPAATSKRAGISSSYTGHSLYTCVRHDVHQTMLREGFSLQCC